MQNKNILTENIDELEDFDDYVQSLDINQLREFEKKSSFLFTNEFLNPNLDEDEFYFEIDNYIQSLQLAELKEIENNSKLINKIN